MVVEGRHWKQSIPLYGRSVRETWRGGSLTGDPENMLSKRLEMDICFHRGLAFGENGGSLS